MKDERRTTRLRFVRAIHPSSFILHPSSFILLTLSLAALSGACRRAPSSDTRQLVAFSGPTMGTWFTVKMVEPPGGSAEQSEERGERGAESGERVDNHPSSFILHPSSFEVEALKGEVDGVLAEVDALMSTYRPDSELSRLNRFAQTDWFAVSPETAAVIDEAVRIGRLSGGAFDVTVAPLVD